MNKFIFALILITHVTSESLTEQERKALLDLHNTKRASVKPTSTNMLEMVYSRKLEKLADDWVVKCIYDHPNEEEYPEYKNLGQNLALSGGLDRNVVNMATEWWEEVKDYIYDTNTCAPGKACGHYTQMVWATSAEVGCAVQRCDNLKPDWPKPVFLMACQYKPAGNYIGVKPYKSGTSCKDCPPGTTCANNLCFMGESYAASAMSSSSTVRVGEVVLFAGILVHYLA